METTKQGTLKAIFRFLGTVLGMVIFLIGVFSLGLSLKFISALNGIAFVILGILFMLYGFAGKSIFG